MTAFVMVCLLFLADPKFLIALLQLSRLPTTMTSFVPSTFSYNLKINNLHVIKNTELTRKLIIKTVRGNSNHLPI